MHGNNSNHFPNPFCQVEHEFIYYVHDGSETATDNFTVGANDTGLRKHSAGQTVYIQVTAVNDEPPVITANRVLRVSQRCCAIFKPSSWLQVGLCSFLSVDFCVGRVASCHGWLGEGSYACYVEEGPWAGIHLEGSHI